MRDETALRVPAIMQIGRENTLSEQVYTRAKPTAHTKRPCPEVAFPF